MTIVDVALRAQLILPACGVVVALTAAGERTRSRLVGTISAATGAAALLGGVAAMTGRTGRVILSTALPLPPLMLAPDRLGGLFMAIAGGVGLVCAVFGIGYAHGPSSSRLAWSAFAVFLPAVQLVPAAADVVALLLFWELMAISSTVLLLAEHALRPAVLSAARWYAAMTQLGFLALVGGLAVWSTDSRSTVLVPGLWMHPPYAVAEAGGPLVLVLLTIGFGAKAALVPLHVWLPRAHPEAPSHVSAVMSGAMAGTGIYGLVLVAVRLVPQAPQWWGLVLVALGLVSALYGILQASVAVDLKRLLGYSTTENTGLMTTALGIAVLLRPTDRSTADIALVACLMLAVSHAAFKTTLFLGAGSILHATGERDLDRMGGLLTRMPWTSAALGISALGAAALPVTAGFVSEWILLQAIIHGARSSDRLVAVVLPLALAGVALTAGLALLTMVKATGIALLARPRSQAIHEAREGTTSMVVAMLAGAGLLVALGLAAGPLAVIVARCVEADGITSTSTAGILLTTAGAGLEPVRLSGAVVVLTAVVAAVAVVAERRRPRRRTALPWGCGGVRLSPRMQYTATSYAEPLVRVFDDALRPTRDVAVTHTQESRFVVAQVRYRQQVEDVVETALYRPVQRLLVRVGEGARRVQNGSIHRYLAYSFAALVALLAAVAR